MSAEQLPLEAHVAALASLEGVGPSTLRWMLGLGPPTEVWERVRQGRLPRRPGPWEPGAEVRGGWVSQAARIEPAALWDRCVTAGIGVSTLGSPGYPAALLDDPDPPVVVFHRGDPDVLVRPMVGIVGTRRATGYGLRQAEILGHDLAGQGIPVVSGLALGIDAAAHRGALATSAATPVAVVGGGLDAPCPQRNRELAERVASQGVLLSEVPPGVRAAPWRFPVRNRIIAALSDALVVVESAGGGGSMHTVREAMSRQRDVLAVPGPIDSPASEGTNRLIVEGALVCQGVADVLSCLGVVPRQAARASSVAAAPRDDRPEPIGDAARVLDRIAWRPISLEDLAQGCDLDFAGVVRAVERLRADGWVETSGIWVERVAIDRRVRGSGGPPA